MRAALLPEGNKGGEQRGLFVAALYVDTAQRPQAACARKQHALVPWLNAYLSA